MGIRQSHAGRISHHIRQREAISSASTWGSDMTPLRSLARIALVGAVMAGVSCKDQDVPFLTGPTTIPNTPVGIQNGITGLFSATRIDLGNYILLADGFGRA